MSEQDTGDVSASKSVYVMMNGADMTAVEELKLEETLLKKGYTCYFSSDDDPRTREPSNFDQMIEKCKKRILIVSRSSFGDKWLEYRWKMLTEYVPFLIDRNMAIEKLPLELRAQMTCLTVRDSKWKSKLSKYLEKEANVSPALGNIAPGLCCSYVHGYLKIVLPDFESRVRQWKTTEQENGSIEANARVVPRMINLIPRSCNCNVQIQDCAPDGRIRRDAAEQPVVCREDYLDTKERNFDMQMFRVCSGGGGGSSSTVTSPGGGDEALEQVYYVVLVLNATIYTLYEMLQDGEIDHDTMIQERSLYETQMTDMLVGQPIDILSFDDDDDDDNLMKKVDEECGRPKQNLADLIVEICRKRFCTEP